jgi:hypothetical protein
MDHIGMFLGGIIFATVVFGALVASHSFVCSY